MPIGNCNQTVDYVRETISCEYFLRYIILHQWHNASKRSSSAKPMHLLLLTRNPIHWASYLLRGTRKTSQDQRRKSPDSASR
ncbi:Uncharacterized protein HZ326_9455 [Fusarium oxysporum f. sp. albedinis]|nr:Uncharacterized protein HZ326_9455 [Fusarium oxysporum f. sp. albedinis]